MEKQRKEFSRFAPIASRRANGDGSEGKRRRSPSPSSKHDYPPRKRSNNSSSTFQDRSEPGLCCILCLSPIPHNKQKCDRATMGCGAPTRCHRDSRNRIVNPDGKTICLEFNRKGCKSSNSKHLHECSGCGSKEHGAQECHLVEKA